jgi:hypothetical protein
MRFLGAITLRHNAGNCHGGRATTSAPWLDSLTSGNVPLLLTPPLGIHIAGLTAHR